MYNAHFKFRESPFGVTPDPQFYYSNAVNREAWATLRYGIEERKGFIVIAGEPGTGKTTLLRKALHSFGSNVETAYISHTLVNQTELLDLILNDLGLANSAGNTSSTIERLYQYSIEQFKKGNVVALLIDEAQDLSLACLEELRLLGNLETDKSKLLQIVLVGQPELERKLGQPELVQLKQRVALRCRLKPVKTEEVGSYIESRLQTIDRRSADVFDPEAINKIALYSKGIPRLINIICDNALLIAYANSKPKVSADMVDEAADDLLIGKSRVGRDIRAPAVTMPVGWEEPLKSAPVGEDEPTIKEEPLLIDSGDHAGPMQESTLSKTDISHGFRRAIGTAAAIVLLTGLGAFVYSHEWGFSISSSYVDSAAPVDSGRKEMNQGELAPPALESKTSTIIPEATLSAPQTQALAVSDHNVSTGEPGKAIAAPAAEENVTVQQATAVIVPEVKKAEGPPRADNEEKSANSANFLVVGPSFVRANPTPSAAIIATLEPGTRITVAGRTGEYYRIRSLGTETIRGYVHKEDAFFERKS
jgi:general secretion pathway protein A